MVNGNFPKCFTLVSKDYYNRIMSSWLLGIIFLTLLGMMGRKKCIFIQSLLMFFLCGIVLCTTDCTRPENSQAFLFFGEVLTFADDQLIKFIWLAVPHCYLLSSLFLRHMWGVLSFFTNCVYIFWLLFVIWINSMAWYSMSSFVIHLRSCLRNFKTW